MVYTAPIKALSNQKYYEFSKQFPDISFGLLTGDIKYNPEADVLIMTTEILRNTLFQKKIMDKGETYSALQFDMDIESELGCVVFDEIHYINDVHRGKVWEETIMLLPTHIQMLMLSATIDKPEKFAKWIEEQHNKKEVWLCATSHRVVPLQHYMYMVTHDSLLDDMVDKSLAFEFRKIVNQPLLIKTPNQSFDDTTFHKINKVKQYIQKNNVYIKRPYILNRLISDLNNKNMLPAICFVFSRRGVEKCADEITHTLFPPESTVPDTIEKECKHILLKMTNWREFTMLPEYRFMIKLLKKGVAIHHSGVLPVLREMVELLFSKGYIKLLFATETFAVGINMPTKTAIFSSVLKYDGVNNRILLGHEYTQMAGRAGRRGLDTIGHVIHLNNLFEIPTISEYRMMVKGDPQKLVSKFKIHYHLVLNLLQSDIMNMVSFMDRSMNKELMENEKISLHSRLDTLEKEYTNYIGILNLTVSDNLLEEYRKCKVDMEYRSHKDKKRFTKKKKELETTYPLIIKEYDQYIKKFEFQDKKLYLENELNFIETYNKETINIFVKIMVKNGQLEEGVGEYIVTNKGKDVMAIQEWNGIVASEVLEKTDYFSTLTSRELIKLFSCFTNITVPDDKKTGYKKHRFCGSTLESVIELVEKYMGYYLDIDIQQQLNTGLEFTYHFDLLPYIDEWLDATNDSTCSMIIKKMEHTKDIFLGEFVKSMIKVNTIALEMEKVAEQHQKMDLLIKLREIPDHILKYVVTTQSLYI